MSKNTFFAPYTKQESGEGITAKVDFDVSSKIKSRLSDSTDQWVLNKSGYFENQSWLSEQYNAMLDFLLDLKMNKVIEIWEHNLQFLLPL